MAISGTPALILPDGELLPGYVPADRLKLILAEIGTAAKR
jgi:protein-disulfide isomerase